MADRATLRIAALSVLLMAAAVAVPRAHAADQAPQEMVLATTTSTADSGLFDSILPPFEKANNVKVKVVAVGTGQALKIGQSGDADVLLVHARAKEDQFVADGYGIDRRDVMHNDYVVVGPVRDPAAIKDLKSAADAFRAIAEKKAAFASRGDESGTHTKEKETWKKAGVEPVGEWYKSLGQGMGDTLRFADESGAYTLADRGTYLAMREKLPDLVVLVGGARIEENPDTSLLNRYGVIIVNPAKHPTVKLDLAKAFVAWITSPETQKEIGAYGVEKFGQPLFYPDVK